MCRCILLLPTVVVLLLLFGFIVGSSHAVGVSPPSLDGAPDHTYPYGLPSEPLPPPDSNLTTPPEWQERAYVTYLRAVCSQRPSGRPVAGHYQPRAILVRLECDRRDLVPLPERYEQWSIPPAAWDAKLGKVRQLQDTADFDLLEMLAVLLHPQTRQRQGTLISAELMVQIEAALLQFKYYYTDPTPQNKTDGMWYWTENHVVCFAVSEYLVGRLYPDSVFDVTGWTGRQHAARAARRLDEWLTHRSRFGFSEFHSDVYYMKNIQALLLLAHHAGSDATFADGGGGGADPIDKDAPPAYYHQSIGQDLARRAEMVLDVLFLDLALHTKLTDGADPMFGSAHGRSYSKDKVAPVWQDTFEVSAVLFGEGYGYVPSVSSTKTNFTYRPIWGGNGAFLVASDYVLPDIIRTIARDTIPLVDRERMGVPISIAPPPSADAAPPLLQYGLSYSDLDLWWGMNAMAAWPLLPSTINTANEFDLWDGLGTSTAVLDFLKAMGSSGGAEAYKGLLFQIYLTAWPVFNMAVLNQANTYTYRTEHYMLSTVQDYNPGLRSNQIHTWQATLSGVAIVFTTHPVRLVVDENDSSVLPNRFDWASDKPDPSYWTGEGCRPRAAQHRNVGVYIYSPQYPSSLLGDISDYREETHAYFPVSHFDQVVRREKWTLGRVGKGYVALYSHIAPTWRTSQPDLYKNGGINFDLVANGTATNVWIVELGSSDEYGSFANFSSVILSSVEPVVHFNGDISSSRESMISSVFYESPSVGTIRFGWTSPLIVDGKEIPLSDYRRYDNSYIQTEFDSTHYVVSHPTSAGGGLALDFDTRERILA